MAGLSSTGVVRAHAGQPQASLSLSLPFGVPEIPFGSVSFPPLPSSCMSPSLAASQGSTLVLVQGSDALSCLKAAPGRSTSSMASPSLSKQTADVESFLKLIPKDAFDVNGILGQAEVVDMPPEGGSNPSRSKSAKVLAVTQST
ncbi:hypothetical protein Nepgr_015909 [Nepenthes gracilis]|uniref:Uncharacterized protein n=1 Tax=Nepenthes gracilis TaxID=150966 RepID=A0AAD3XR51_NEPGR|nr:hypothetical protein Nepgr_015909 [Nepenthes gracilis]